MNKHDYNSHMIYFQKARFFRQTNTNEFAYCIEPFLFFNEESSYESTTKPTNLSESQIDRLSKIAHFGYGYKNHTEPKWYAITQFMIWQAATKGDFYFTDSLNGNRINAFQDEINEINALIDEYNKIPSFDEEYTIISGNKLVLEANLDNIKVIGDNIEIEDNKLIIDPIKENTYTYKLIKEDNYYNKPVIFYQSPNSQDLIETGNIESKSTSFKVNVIKTEIEITKIDKDTKSIIPKGEASLDGAVYSLYNINNELVKEVVIENNQAIIDSIPLGKYYLKENKAGTGYLLDTNTYEVNITKEKSKHQVIVENKVIEKTITIEKKYGETNNLKEESNISFEIYNSNYERISTITTNNLGIAEIILPYGKYIIKQINTTNGYNKVDDITIKIDNTDNELIELKDLKIEVPNTSTNNYLLILILKYLLVIW
ncbi:MAG: Cys-Gln thioester bond-forming surface protein [Bacilli bacterium]|nr:Cys-Gln thioester bond-forming surface protein [Bacilli bacterium]